MNDLAAALGTSKRTLYAYYSSKDQLVEAVVEQFIAEMKQMERDIYENERLNVLEKVKNADQPSAGDGTAEHGIIK